MNDNKVIEYLEKENKKLKEENNELYKRIGELEFQLKMYYKNNNNPYKTNNPSIPTWVNPNITCNTVEDYEPENRVIKIIPKE